MMKLRRYALFAMTLTLGACDSTPSGSPPATAPIAATPSSVQQEPARAATTTTEATTPSTTMMPSPASTTATTAPAAVDGRQLAQSSGCFVCHAIDRKVIGPPWRDVAKRYRGDAQAREQLIKKVHTGGKGNWTDLTGGVMMPPYSPRVTDDNIAALVDFILALPDDAS